MATNRAGSVSEEEMINALSNHILRTPDEYDLEFGDNLVKLLSDERTVRVVEAVRYGPKTHEELDVELIGSVPEDYLDYVTGRLLIMGIFDICRKENEAMKMYNNMRSSEVAYKFNRKRLAGCVRRHPELMGSYEKFL